ncbi:hypothetical protein ACFOKF_25390 [Sphingobium rhizovicinum]|uniref:Uncharacterized protein n=1 Tax=Sphingobium rhizovicinum TaxID=432308 RepID=A0ABV7NPY1_9SPHN
MPMRRWKPCSWTSPIAPGFARAADMAEARFGPIHMLIGNAGIG